MTDKKDTKKWQCSNIFTFENVFLIIIVSLDIQWNNSLQKMCFLLFRMWIVILLVWMGTQELVCYWWVNVEGMQEKLIGQDFLFTPNYLDLPMKIKYNSLYKHHAWIFIWKLHHLKSLKLYRQGRIYVQLVCGFLLMKHNAI